MTAVPERADAPAPPAGERTPGARTDGGRASGERAAGRCRAGGRTAGAGAAGGSTAAGRSEVQARHLAAALAGEPWGQVSPSVYETGRLVTFVPWLTGHAARVDYLVRTQRNDGGWGAPEAGYALVPTLSATEALLAEIDRGAAGGPPAAAAANGLDRLLRWLNGPDAPAAATLPDMPAIELIVPSLVLSINRRLDALGGSPAPAPLGDRPRLRPPAGMSTAVLGAIRDGLAAGHTPPRKLLHALEIGGTAARGHRLVRPEVTGVVGASPAATAAWLGDPAPSPPGGPLGPAAAGAPLGSAVPYGPQGTARRFLETAVRAHGGPVPCGLPITVFERSWVLSWLARAGLRIDPPRAVVTELADAIGPGGAAAAAGLPADADTTAGALYALALVGRPVPPEPLWAFETDTHFCTWPGEDGDSVTTNAHVLEAFGQYVAGGASGSRGRTGRYGAAAAKVAEWLCARQREDGSWQDRWHASPYYATACCALALHRFGGPRAAPAVRRAVRWTLATQRPEGSWGHWSGTPEETAYAVQLLLLTREPPLGTPPAAPPATSPDAECARAAARGRDHLSRVPADPDDPRLWHDKDLYLPIAIVRAAVLAALHLGTRHLRAADG